jgi:hypothetical protein
MVVVAGHGGSMGELTQLLDAYPNDQTLLPADSGGAHLAAARKR